MRFFSNAIRKLLPALTAVCVISVTSPVSSQVVPEYRRHTPLSQWQMPGTAAGMSQMAGRGNPAWFQPVRVILEDGGDVSVYHSRPATPFKQATPAQFGVLVGHMYRLKVEGIPGLPGVELYPTLEIVDRLHPPRGQKHNFPIEIPIDRRDIDHALAGNLVTRVVYLEQPTIAAPFELDESTRTRDLDKMDNALAQADRFGRPMVILRLGGRLPSPHGEPQRFWGSGGLISKSVPTVPKKTDEAQARTTRSRGKSVTEDLARGTSPSRSPKRFDGSIRSQIPTRGSYTASSNVAIPTRRRAGQP